MHFEKFFLGEEGDLLAEEEGRALGSDWMHVGV